MEGRKLVAICNSNGAHVGAFYAPTTPIPQKLYTEATAKLKCSFVSLNCLNIAPDGTIKGKSGRTILARAEQRIYALFDELLGYRGAAEAFFNTLRPFAKVKGKFYCEQCLDVVKQYVDFEGEKIK